jgi:hypothetical protein
MTPIDLETALQRSIERYRQMIGLLGSIEQEVGTASDEGLRQMNTLLLETQNEVSAADRLIMEYSKADTALPVSIRNLLAEREKLVGDVLLLNRNVTIKAMGVRSLLAHEIGTLRNGKTALSGYRSPQHNQGRIVNRSL